MSLQALIKEKLRRDLEPSHLEVINESSKHNAPPEAESHFKVIIVSKKFEGRLLLHSALVWCACWAFMVCSTAEKPNQQHHLTQTKVQAESPINSLVNIMLASRRWGEYSE